MPTRAGYSFVGWRGRNLINIYKGYANDNGHVTYAIGKNDTITIQNDANTDSGTNRYDCALIPIEDLTEGKYRLSAENISYTGGNHPIIYVAGVIDGGTYSTNIAFNYSQTCFDISNFSPINSVTNKEYESGRFRIEVYLALTSRQNNYKTFEAGSLSFSNLMLTKVSSENEIVRYEPYYIESNTVFGTPGDRTLTAVWSQNSILTGGALQTESDLSSWENRYGGASITTFEGYACTKLEMSSTQSRILLQSIKGKYEPKTTYVLNAKINLRNLVVPTSFPEDPVILIYTDGYYNDSWVEYLSAVNIYETGASQSKYNNIGWIDLHFMVTTSEQYSDTITSSSSIDTVEFVIFTRCCSGQLYVRDVSLCPIE